MREWVKGQLSTVFVCCFLQKPFALPCPQLNCAALCALAGTSSSNSVCKEADVDKVSPHHHHLGTACTDVSARTNK